jgi:hypothetical protein
MQKGKVRGKKKNKGIIWKKRKIKWEVINIVQLGQKILTK